MDYKDDLENDDMPNFKESDPSIVLQTSFLQALPEPDELQLHLIDCFINFYTNPRETIRQLIEFREQIEDLPKECCDVLVHCYFFKNFSEFIALVSEEDDVLILNLLASFSQMEHGIVTELAKFKSIIEFVINHLFSSDKYQRMTAIEILDDFARDENEKVRGILLLNGLDAHLMLIIESHLKTQDYNDFFLECCSVLSILSMSADINSMITKFIPTVLKILPIDHKKIRKCIGRILCNAGKYLELNLENPEFYQNILEYSSNHFDEQVFICLILRFFASRAKKPEAIIILLDHQIFNYIIACLESANLNDSIFMCVASLFESIAIGLTNGSQIIHENSNFFNIVENIFINGMIETKIIAANALCQFLLNLDDETKEVVVEEHIDLIKQSMFPFENQENSHSINLLLSLLYDIAVRDNAKETTFAAQIILDTDLVESIEELSNCDDERIQIKAKEIMNLVSLE